MEFATGEDQENPSDIPNDIPDDILQINILELYCDILDINPDANFVDIYNTIGKKFPTGAIVNDVTNYWLVKTKMAHGLEKDLADVITIFHIYLMIKKSPNLANEVVPDLKRKMVEKWNKFIDSLDDIPD